MIRYDLDVAKSRQEQYRAEAAASRLASHRTTSPLAAIGRFIRAAIDAPALAPGSVLPATH